MYSPKRLLSEIDEVARLRTVDCGARGKLLKLRVRLLE